MYINGVTKGARGHMYPKKLAVPLRCPQMNSEYHHLLHMANDTMRCCAPYNLLCSPLEIHSDATDVHAW